MGRFSRKQEAKVGSTTVDWNSAAVEFGIPDGPHDQTSVLDTLTSSPGGAGHLSRLWGFINTDPILRTDLLRRLDSSDFFEVEGAIHALKGGVELPEVQRAFAEIAVRYAHPESLPLGAEQCTFGLSGIHPLDPRQPNDAQMALAGMFQAGRTHSANLAENVVIASREISDSPILLKAYEQILLMRDPRAHISVREEIFGNLSPCRAPTPPAFFDWMVEPATYELLTESRAQLSAGHYLALHLGESAVCDAVRQVIFSEKSDPLGEKADWKQSFAISVLAWGVNKYKVSINGPVSALVEAVREAPLGRFSSRERDALLK
ncbi:hypothetical protein OAO01_03345 [Oligoflexia bacterium]|nr:hypothetical protein [Oligoflexia bacterium]